MDTNKAELEKVIRQAIIDSANEDGWANLAKIGIQLRKNGIKYGKLSRFFADYTYMVETKVDTTIQPPIAYAKIIPESA